MKVHSVLIPVNDIDSAINFYTQNLFFKKMKDLSKIEKITGFKKRKVSLCSTQSNNVEIIFSTLINSFNPLLDYQKKLHELGVPYLYLSVFNVDAEYHRLLKSGIIFSIKPKLIGIEKIAVFEDGCGNHIQIVEHI
jgi:predicted enzyme related to lactoylglutathione lyase